MWRVPKDRGAPTYFAALLEKSLRKHGWPATVELAPGNWGEGVQVLHHDTGLSAASDFWAAAQVAVRVLQRTHKLELETSDRGLVMFRKEYDVTPAGKFKVS